MVISEERYTVESRGDRCSNATRLDTPLRGEARRRRGPGRRCNGPTAGDGTLLAGNRPSVAPGRTTGDRPSEGAAVSGSRSFIQSSPITSHNYTSERFSRQLSFDVCFIGRLRTLVGRQTTVWAVVCRLRRIETMNVADRQTETTWRHLTSENQVHPHCTNHVLQFVANRLHLFFRLLTPNI